MEDLMSTAVSAIQTQTTDISTKILYEAVERLKSEPIEFKSTGYYKSEAYHERLLEKARYYNSVPGNLRFYDCPECKNKGVIEYITEDWDESCRVCKCMKIRACYEAMSRSGITSEMLNRFTFDKYSEMKEYQTQMKHAALRYTESDLTGWLYFGGQSGAGKTHLCTATAKKLLARGHEVKYVLWHDFARKIKALRYKIEEYDAYIREIAKAEILYIDDLFKADKSTDAAFELINLRYMSRKPTIISSELFVSDIIRMDEALGSRINEMCRDFCVLVSQEPDRNFRDREVS